MIKLNTVAMKKEELLELLTSLQNGTVELKYAYNKLWGLVRVSGRKFFTVEGGGDWADASIDYFINLTDRTGEEVHKEYDESGGYHGNGKKWFRQWAIDKEYMREPTDSELETYYDGL